MAPKQDKRTLYVGGLEEDVDINTLRSAFIPFGEVRVAYFGNPAFSIVFSV
jgi:hypothetical protein